MRITVLEEYFWVIVLTNLVVDCFYCLLNEVGFDVSTLAILNGGCQ